MADEKQPIITSTDPSIMSGEAIAGAGPTGVPTQPSVDQPIAGAVPGQPISSERPPEMPNPATPSFAQPGKGGGIGASPMTPDQYAKAREDMANKYAESKGGFFRTLAQSLAGGPGYRVETNPNTGEIKKVPVPLSGKQIAMAIALEAISGGLAGLAGGQGRGGPGGAAGAGLSEGMNIAKMKQQATSQDEQLASQNLTRQASIAHTNMAMAQGQRMLADADYKMHQQEVQSFSSVYDEAQKGGFVDEVVSEDKLHQLLTDGSRHVTKDMAIPIGVVKKMNGDGTPAKGPNGEDVYEKRWAILKPNAQITMPDDVKKLLVQHKVQGYVNGDGQEIKLPDDFQQRIHMVVNGIQKANNIRTVDSMIQGYANGQKNFLHEGTKPNTQPTTPNGKPSVQPAGSLWNLYSKQDGSTDFDKLADAITKHEGKPGDLNYRNNNPGNLVDPKTGQLRKFDSMDAGRAALVSQLQSWQQRFPNISPIEFINGNGAEFKGYSSDSAPGNKPGQAQTYADHLIKASGKNIEEMPGGGVKQPDNDQLAAATSQLTDDDYQAIISAGGLEAFVDGKPGQLSTAQKLAQQKKLDPQAVGRITGVLNTVKPIDDVRKEREKSEADAKIAEQTQLERQKLQIKDEEESKLPAGSMTPQEASKETPDKDGVRQNYLLSLPPEVQATVKEIGEGRNTNITAYALGRSKEAAKWRQMVSLAYPDYDWAKVDGYEKMRQDMVSGKESQRLEAINTAMQHLKVLYDNAGPLNTKPGLGAAMANFGNDAANNVQSARVGLRTEISKIYKGGVPDKDEQKLWGDVLDRWTESGTQSSVKSLINLLDGMLSSEVQKWKNGVPSKAVKPIQFMSDESQGVYKDIMGHDPKTLKAIGGQAATPQPLSGKTWSAKAWAAANPNGDVEAAKKAAKAQNANVVD